MKESALHGSVKTQFFSQASIKIDQYLCALPAVLLSSFFQLKEDHHLA